MRIILAIFIILPLSGCLDPVYKGVHNLKELSLRQYIKTMASNGDVEYQYKAGKLYCCGERPLHDNVEALRWFCQAAKNGQRDAMLAVGKLYETANQVEGGVIPKDDVLAYAYYVVAVNHDNPNAGTYRDKLAEKLSERQRDQANMLASRWPKIHCKITRD